MSTLILFYNDKHHDNISILKQLQSRINPCETKIVMLSSVTINKNANNEKAFVKTYTSPDGEIIPFFDHTVLPRQTYAPLCTNNLQSFTNIASFVFVNCNVPHMNTVIDKLLTYFDIKSTPALWGFKTPIEVFEQDEQYSAGDALDYATYKDEHVYIKGNFEVNDIQAFVNTIIHVDKNR